MTSARRARLVEVMARENLDLLLISSPFSMYYFSGFTGKDGMLAVTSEGTCLITDGRYAAQAESEVCDIEVVECKGAPVCELGRFKAKRVGFEAGLVDVAQYREVKKQMPESGFHDCTAIISTLRSIKDEEELSLIAGAAEIADAAFAHVIKYIKPGIYEADIALELEFFMKRRGASALSFDTIVASGRRGAFAHGEASRKKIEAGELVVIDFGCVFCHYASDMTRTVAVGEPSAVLKEMYSTTLSAQLAALDAVRAGERLSEPDSRARKIIDARPELGRFSHSLGHGVGLEVHEEPRLSQKSVGTLEENMVITIEPGIYNPEVGGVRIEDLAAVTRNGCRILSKTDKELIVL